jgi:D-alanyl-D-alanine carboxypeptidase
MQMKKPDKKPGIDYLVLVNGQHPLPVGWTDRLETVSMTNSTQDRFKVEKKTAAAYELLKAGLERDNIYLELDSALRSVAAQQDLLDRFAAEYGAEKAAKIVAPPGYSEHHTGLALDICFRLRKEDGSFDNVYSNEDMLKEKYRSVWNTIYGKMTGYGFILRYPEGSEQITGYDYEPWHIRYLDDSGIAAEIMSQPGLTLEEYLEERR